MIQKTLHDNSSSKHQASLVPPRYEEFCAEGLVLAAWLNAAGGHPSGRRVRTILESIAEWSRYVQGKSLAKLKKNTRRIFELWGKTDTLLSRYKFSPVIRYVGNFHFKTWFDWKPSNARKSFHLKFKGLRDPMFKTVMGSEIPYIDEQSAVFLLYRLAEKRALGYLSCCDCGQWFLARRADQAYCSTKCRRSIASSSENFREQRRLYMRNYRHQLKERDERSIQRLRK
jgi:hypothetical protein